MKIINDFTEEEFHEMLREEAFEEGVQRGIAQGMERGMSQGMERGIEQTVRSMLADELPIDKIALYTGYDVERVERIKKEVAGV